MGADLPPCERTGCRGRFPRPILDVLWLRASVIMPRSWLRDGFSTIRAHYSSLGLSCSSLHPHRTRSHTRLHTEPLPPTDRWKVAHAHKRTQTIHKHTYRSLPPGLRPAQRAWAPCLLKGGGWGPEPGRRVAFRSRRVQDWLRWELQRPGG